MKIKNLFYKLSFSVLALLFAVALSLVYVYPVQAAQTRAVTVITSNSSLGAVNSARNGNPFSNYTYADEYDTITVSALPVNTHYCFTYWTDNGAIISKNTTYSFSPSDRNHVIVGHFTSKEERKDQHYDTDNNISSITRNVNPCTFASGYKLDGMTINASLTTIDDATKAALEAMTSGTFAGAAQISFSYGYEGKNQDTLSSTVHLTLQIPAEYQKAGRFFRVFYVSSTEPSITEDLDDKDTTVTFPAAKAGIYLLAYSDTPFTNAALVPSVQGTTPATEATASATAAPQAQSSTVTTPAATAPAVTDQEYLNSVINVLRYQLQQAGIDPAM